MAKLNSIAKAKGLSTEQVLQEFAENSLTEMCGEPAKMAEVLEFKRPCKTKLPDGAA